MAHLKKLADRLKLPVPVIKQPIQFGDKNDRVLSTKSNLVNHLSRRLEQFVIPSLKLTASKFSLASLAAKQLGFSEAVFIIHNQLIDHQWSRYTTQDYSAFINPELVKVSLEETSEVEECVSAGLIKAHVTRSTQVTLNYMNDAGEYVETEFSGFPARVVQHELDHLWGFTILNYSVSYGNLVLPREEQNKALAELIESIQPPKQTVSEDDVDERAFYTRTSVGEELEDTFRQHVLNSLKAKRKTDQQQKQD